MRKLHESDRSLIERESLHKILHVSDDVVKRLDFWYFWHLSLLQHSLSQEEDLAHEFRVEIGHLFQNHVEVLLQLWAQFDVVHVGEIQ